MNSELSKPDNVVSGTLNGYQHSQPENHSNYQSVISGGALSVVKRENVMLSNNKGRNQELSRPAAIDMSNCSNQDISNVSH